jgi:drug/metabolite transporter (DMT)-like permease
LYNESVSTLKIFGIAIAIFAVYLASVKNENHKNPEAGLLFPILLFLGSGAIDTLLKYLEVNYVPKEDVSAFSGSLFGFAAFFGAIIILIKTLKKREAFGLKNIIAGVLLGVPNYFSIIFLIKALQVEGFESSALFTMNNVGIVVVSTLVGVLLFKEKMSAKNITGVVLAILGIVIVALT